MSSELALHDYQIVARDFLRGNARAGLFLDMIDRAREDSV